MKQVIILEKDETTAQVRFRFALWAAVPLARQASYANANATSVFSGIAAQELLDIQAGKVRERVDFVCFANGTAIAVIQAALQQTWIAFQAEVNASNPWNRYGTFWDGTSWTAAGVS